MSEEIDATLAAILANLEGDQIVEPVPTEWPDAKVLCVHYGAVMRNLPGYRQGMAASDIVTLAYEFAVIDHMVALFAASDNSVARLAGPTMSQLRDICAAEGHRRGVMLSAGDDVTAISLAVELVDEMIAAFTPGFVMSAGRRG